MPRKTGTSAQARSSWSRGGLAHAKRVAGFEELRFSGHWGSAAFRVCCIVVTTKAETKQLCVGTSSPLQAEVPDWTRARRSAGVRSLPGSRDVLGVVGVFAKCSEGYHLQALLFHLHVESKQIVNLIV